MRRPCNLTGHLESQLEVFSALRDAFRYLTWILAASPEELELPTDSVSSLPVHADALDTECASEGSEYLCIGN